MSRFLWETSGAYRALVRVTARSKLAMGVFVVVSCEKILFRRLQISVIIDVSTCGKHIVDFVSRDCHRTPSEQVGRFHIVVSIRPEQPAPVIIEEPA